MPPEDPLDGDNPDRPQWLPENFKSPEAFAQAYSEAQRKITEQGQQLSAQNETLTTFAQQLEELTALQTHNQPQADQSQIDNQWAQMYENDPFGTMVLLNQQLAQQNAEALRQEIAGLSSSQMDDRRNAIDLNSDLSMREKYEDWNSLRDEVREEIENNPVFTKEHFDSLSTAKAALDQAYRNVKASKGADDDQQGFDARQMKLAAQGLQGAGGRPAPEDEAKAAWERIRDAGKNSTYSELMGGR